MDGALRSLEEWGKVLERLQEWKKQRELDRHAPELVRLLRTRDNWRLREHALEAVTELSSCPQDLQQAVLDILVDDTLYHEVRVLAAEALRALMARDALRAAGDAARIQPGTLERMRRILDSPQPPILHQAIRRVLPTVE
jgi:hypothetical protein